MKKILVPTDFSSCAQAAATVALQIAVKSKGELFFLHLALDKASKPLVPGIEIPVVAPGMGIEQHELNQLVKRAEAMGIAARAILVRGNGSERIEDYIQPYQIDFLVMGSHGVTGIREKIIGSKTQRALRHVQVPSLVVKYTIESFLPRHIVFASTFKKDHSGALKPVVKFSSLWKSTIHLLFINLLDHLIEENTAREMMASQMKHFENVPYTTNITETNDKEFGILAFAGQFKTDVISTVMHSHGVLGRLMNPDLAEQLINHAKIPVLIIHSKD